MRHALRGRLELGVVPALAAVGGDFHLANGSATGPGQSGNRVESCAPHMVSGRRESDHGFGLDLVLQRSCNRRFIQLPKLVVLYVVPVHYLDSPQILRMKNSLEA